MNRRQIIKLSITPIAAAIAIIAAVSATAVSEAEPSVTLTGLQFQTITLRDKIAHAATDRPVAPAYAGVQQWISAVGAAGALADLSGSGRASDYCLVDPRDNSVTVGNADPNRPSYKPVTLSLGNLPHDATMAPMGCVPADLDEDGDQDLIVYYWGRSPVVFLRTGREHTTPDASSFTPHELVSPEQVWNTTALNVGDIDGDGHLDIVVGNYFPDGAKVLDPHDTTPTGTVMQDSMSDAHNGGVNRIIRTIPTGRANTMPITDDQSSAFPFNSAHSWTLAIGLQDLTGDLLPDMYIANDFGPDNLLLNRSTPGHIRFTQVEGKRNLLTPKSEVLGHDSFKGMGVTFSYNGAASLPRIIVSNITSNYALQESNFFFVPTGGEAELNHGDVVYADESEEKGIARSGWSWDIKAGDFNNDGTDEFLQATGFVKGSQNEWPKLQEIAMGNDGILDAPSMWPIVNGKSDLSGHEKNRLWTQTTDGRYADDASQAGLGQEDVSRGIALGDVNDDGRLDALVANQWGPSRLEINTDSSAGPGESLYLERPGAGGSTVPAIGAQVTVVDRRAPAQKRQLYPANGHAGVSAPSIPITRSTAPRGTKVQIQWRDLTGSHSVSVTVPQGTQAHIILNPQGTASIE